MITKTNLVYNVNSEYGSYHNISNLIDQANNELAKLDSCIGEVNPTYKYNLTKNASTYIAIGDRRTDLKIIADYTIKRGSTYETGTFNILNNESSSYLIDVSGGLTGFDFKAKIVDVDFIYDADISTNTKLLKWSTCVYYNNKIYGLPRSEHNIIEIDENTYDVSYYGDFGYKDQKFSSTTKSYVLYNDKIYIIPYNYDKIIIFDTSTKVVTELGDTDVSILNKKNQKWGAALLGLNNKIYGIPYDDTRVLELNPVDNSINYYELDASGGYAASNPILCPNGNIYVPPYNMAKGYTGKVLEINTATNDVSINLLGDPSTFCNGISNFLYQKTNILYNDKVYCLPYSGNRVLIINSFDGSLSYIDSSILGNRTAKFYVEPSIINNKIYAIPYGYYYILGIDPVDNSINFYGDSSVITSNSLKWSNQIVVNNMLYTTPYTDKRILRFNPLDGSIISVDVSVYGTNIKFTNPLFYNDKIYCVPGYSRYGLEINPSDLTYNLLGDPNEIDSSTYSLNCVLTDSGKIFTLPYASTKALILDPEKRELRLIAKDTSTNTNDASINFTTKIIKK